MNKISNKGYRPRRWSRRYQPPRSVPVADDMSGLTLDEVAVAAWGARTDRTSPEMVAVPKALLDELMNAAQFMPGNAEAVQRVALARRALSDFRRQTP